jgi:tryptophan-rich sensory protein
MSRSWILPVAVAAVAALAVAALGGTITDIGPWYEGLRKPGWTPPPVVFPIVWTAIFACAAVAGVAAWRAAPTARQSDTVIGLFALNGFLNVAWSLLFFRVHRPDWAMLELLLLEASIVALVLYCGRFSRVAALLLVPYLVWVAIAGWLNWQVVQLNPPFG